MSYKIEGIVSEYPSGLKSAEQMAGEIGLSVKRIVALAKGGFAPHYCIDGGEPLFRSVEFKRWAARNLIERIEGRDLPEPVKVGLSLAQMKAARKVPISLKEMQGLCDITGEYNRSGIYFLCNQSELQYIGQSVNVHSRVTAHNKKYNQVLFLPWPADDLDRIEGALIRYLSPPLNGRVSGKSGKMTAPPEIHPGADREIIDHLTEERFSNSPSHHPKYRRNPGFMRVTGAESMEITITGNGYDGYKRGYSMSDGEDGTELEECRACESGYWEAECCNGSGGCSCQGERVQMGACRSGPSSGYWFGK